MEESGDSKGTWKALNDLMNWKSKNTQSNEIKISSSEIASNPKQIVNHLNKHFTEIGNKLAYEIPYPQNDITFRSYITKTNTVFKLQKVTPTRMLKLLSTLDSTKATTVNKISNKFVQNDSSIYPSVSLQNFLFLH